MQNVNGKGKTTTDSGVATPCEKVVPTWQILLNNTPTAVMFVLGGTLLGLIWWGFSIVFLLYCGLAIVLFWRLICSHCHYFNTRACPCGYGIISARLFRPQRGKDFHKVFRRNIGIMFPCWFIPLGGGIYLLWSDFSWPVLGLFLAFCVVGFVLIPGLSKLIGCRECDQKDDCPWMKAPRKN